MYRAGRVYKGIKEAMELLLTPPPPSHKQRIPVSLTIMMQPGPDPSFPYLNCRDRFDFPDPAICRGNIVAVGGNLSPGMLLSAYEQGIFPWYGRGDPIIWQSPDPRFLLFPENLHVSRSMERILRKNAAPLSEGQTQHDGFGFGLDRNFEAVMQGCAAVARAGQDGTWIDSDILAAYTELHHLGWAHSAESYDAAGNLVGGLYGIRLGGVFAGESMFSLRPNASKAAFIRLARILFADGVAFIDCQVHSDHLESLGGVTVSRSDFLALLRSTLGERINSSDQDGGDVSFGDISPRAALASCDRADRRGSWQILAD